MTDARLTDGNRECMQQRPDVLDRSWLVDVSCNIRRTERADRTVNRGWCSASVAASQEPSILLESMSSRQDQDQASQGQQCHTVCSFVVSLFYLSPFVGNVVCAARQRPVISTAPDALYAVLAFESAFQAWASADLPSLLSLERQRGSLVSLAVFLFIPFNSLFISSSSSSSTLQFDKLEIRLPEQLLFSTCNYPFRWHLNIFAS